MEKVGEKLRDILFFESYFEDFFVQQKPKVKEKIIWTLELLQELPVIPAQYLKHIHGTDGLYEIRIQNGGDIFRIFCYCFYYLLLCHLSCVFFVRRQFHCV